MSKVYKIAGIPLTMWLVIILFIIFIFEMFLPAQILDLLIFVPYYSIKNPWTYITSIFLSGSIYQLFVDGLALFFLGIAFEYLYGSRNLITLFILSGIFGNFAFFLQYFNNPLVGGLGASGAISGILGALAVLRPKEKIIIFPIIIPIDMFYAAIFWIIFNLIGLIYPFAPIGFSAHIGGTLFGMLYGYLLKKRLKKEDTIVIS
jgi:membrane associated rhomboid family serine protease